MSISTYDLEKRLAQLKREVPTRGFEKHLAILNNISELHAELQSPAVTALADRGAIQTMIAFPPQIQRGRHYVPRQALLFTPTDVIHILASIWPGQPPRVTEANGSGLMYMKVTLLLLYGFLEIVTQGEEAPTRLGMEFNTVAWIWLSKPVRQLVQAAKASPGAGTRENKYSPGAKQAFDRLSLKFSNGVKIHGLLPGEGLEELVFQPGTWKPWLYLLRRQVTANTLLLLTSNYVAVIQEELNIKQGWIVSHIPRNCIVGMQNRPNGLWNELTVQLKRAGQPVDYRLLLKREAVEEWRRLWMQHGGKWEDLDS